MTRRWADDKVESIRSELPPDDLNRFNTLYEDALESTSEEEVRDDLERGYQESEDHLELVTAVASGFHQTPIADGHSSGYEFAITEPLEELNHTGDEEVTNGDVLLVRETEDDDDDGIYLCIVECKAGSEASGRWISKLQGIRDVMDTEEYRQRLKSQIGFEDTEIKYTQCALLGMIIPIHSMNYEKLSEDMDLPDDFTFWGYDGREQAMVHVEGEVRDKPLAGVIKDSIDAGKVENPLEFTYGDHPLTQMKVLIEDIIKEKKQEGDEHPFEFKRSEFRERFDGHLEVGFSGDRREELVDERVERILDVGLKIGIFVDDDLNSERDYRIYFRGSKYHVAKSSVEQKYFDEMSVERKKERALEQACEEFTREQTRLDDDWRTFDGQIYGTSE
jgi:hypothetical protein